MKALTVAPPGAPHELGSGRKDETLQIINGEQNWQAGDVRCDWYRRRNHCDFKAVIAQQWVRGWAEVHWPSYRIGPRSSQPWCHWRRGVEMITSHVTKDCRSLASSRWSFVWKSWTRTAGGNNSRRFRILFVSWEGSQNLRVTYELTVHHGSWMVSVTLTSTLDRRALWFIIFNLFWLFLYQFDRQSDVEIFCCRHEWDPDVDWRAIQTRMWY